MFSEKRRKARVKYTFYTLILAVCASISLLAISKMEKDVSSQSAMAVKDAVIKSAVLCYSTEGSYPKSVSYLEKYYGLVLNKRKFIVSYEAYADNLMPEVRVLVKGQE